MVHVFMTAENLKQVQTFAFGEMTKLDNYGMWGKKAASPKYREYGCCCCKIHSN